MRPPDSATIFDVQRFSLHDGPGIRTTVFFKGCPLRCAWCQNPESLGPHPEMAFFADRCRDTRACAAACPRDAVSARGDRIRRDRCDACGACEPACPHRALERVGREVPLDALLAEILRDRSFYESSGGGVTLSGGEPTFQMSAMGALAQRCRSEGVPVLLQTCGAFRFDAFAPHLRSFDRIFFDLKLMDPERHRRFTRADNPVILENARLLTASGAPVTFRMPIVPGITDDLDNLSAAAAFLREIGASSLHLLRYHRMGEAKLARLGYPLAPLAMGAGDVGRAVARAAALLAECGIEVAV
ncbi:MAG: glycyl-radical enzyme activating protein [Deltaproteobacteria bacterium]|nr:glycyl-radical enzyme activating protein [Deltaproteobacteria bacterium]